MPRHIKAIAYAGNGLLAIAFALFATFTLGRGQLGLFLFFAAVAALGLWNLYVIWKAAYLLSEEQWLEAELRKAELREQLRKMGRFIPGRRGQPQPPADQDPEGP